jgi:SAM-dependent methyltransferase
MARISIEDFELRYRNDPDPWGYTRAPYERRKYAATLAACGASRFACALELGGSIGVFSALLAPRCQRLVTIDAAPTAVRTARQRLSDQPHVEMILGEIPGAVPEESFELVVASEILYYLSASELEATLEMLRARMRGGARLVAVHWRPSGPERPFAADEIHRILRVQAWLEPVTRADTADYRLDVLARR